MAEEQAIVTALSVDTGRGPFDIEAYLDTQADTLQMGRNRFKAKTIESNSPVSAILKEAKDYDLVVIGTTNKPLLFQIGRQSLPEKIARRCKKPVIIVKSDVGVRSWIKKWI